MNNSEQHFSRAQAFCERFGLRVPILLAPMAGTCPPSLSIAVAQAGGMGACGALLFEPDKIKGWAAEVRAATGAPFQINLWVPDPPPVRDAAHEAKVREFLSQWGPAVPPEAGDSVPPDFNAQCETLLEINPAAVSSIMGLYPAEFVHELKRRRIAWFATITTVGEALLAEEAGADVLIAQGMEAGGHRGVFDATKAEEQQVGLMALLPAVVDAVRLPVLAAGGIADGRGVAAALTLGASAAIIGTGFLRTVEAKLHPAWAAALAETAPESTMLTRAFSGRACRTIKTNYCVAAASPNAPTPAPYPVQRGLTAPMRADAQRCGDVHRMQALAGQSAKLARAESATEVVSRIWQQTQSIFGC
jgi:nitronate monooxygenase